MLFAIVHTNLGVFIHDADQPIDQLYRTLAEKYRYHQNVKIKVRKTAPSLV